MFIDPIDCDPEAAADEMITQLGSLCQRVHSSTLTPHLNY